MNGTSPSNNNNNVIDVDYDDDSSSSSSSWLHTLECEETGGADITQRNHDPSSRGKRSCTASTGSVNNNNNDLVEKYSKTTKEVRQIKLVIILVLLISIAGAIAVFVYTKNSEQDQFVNQFEDDANKIVSSVLNSMERRLGAFNNLASTFVTIAQATNQTFPFVRIPNFGALVARTIQLTNAVSTAFTPIVRPEVRSEWENYTAPNSTNAWSIINETVNYQRNFRQFYGPMPEEYNWTFVDSLYSDYGPVPYNETSRFFLPAFQVFPLLMRVYPPLKFDWYTILDDELINNMMTRKKAFVTRTSMIDKPDDPEVTATNVLWCDYYRDFLPPYEECLEPIAFWYYPVINKIDYIDVTSNPNYPDDYEVQGFIVSDIYWKHLLRDILPPNSKGIVIVFQHELYKEQFTYQIDGPVTKFLGGGDKHDPTYDPMCIKRDLFDLDSYRIGKDEYYGLPVYVRGNNTYTLFVYPSDEMKARFTTNKPIIFAVSAVAFILFPFLVFLVYDHIMKRQHEEIVNTANRSHAIVSSLFPSNVRDQLFPQDVPNSNMDSKGLNATTNKSLLPMLSGPPIAELYPETTVLFCDLVDFTKWSSVRDPAQVFTLLESLYGSFDLIANRRNVFKVETIGDCYVAVAGLPDPRKDHAEVMARFANDILKKMSQVTAELGTILGPGTSVLQMRVGINSGPTTAGVLRGAKSRFQLFGDTVNTAARMESNSMPGRILCSQKTADLLTAAGKERWIVPRESLVDAKGKGFMQCYWVTLKKAGPVSSANSSSVEEEQQISSGKHDHESQTVTWMAEILESLLHQVIIQRGSTSGNTELIVDNLGEPMVCPRDEVSELIVISGYDKNVAQPQQLIETSKVTISDSVRQQINDYVQAIANLYRHNPFHNFTHACHVVMTTRKLLNRVVKPTEGCASSTAYGITSDPLSQFAIVFSALIHDVDHPGVSNLQLVKEKDQVALRYHNKSVAEQNSVCLAWTLLLEPQYTDFRNLIMANGDDRQRFRQLIINSVMATDLFDTDLKQLRETRWARVFKMDEDGTSKTAQQNLAEDYHRRATIIIEHIIQASDVSHTMQHWHVYQEWNRRLFNEMYKAYVDGRAEKDPSLGWYEGELWFFDNYIIPLAKKLEACGVFGVSCGELLDYAQDNRAEWASKGRDIVAESLRLFEAVINADGDNYSGKSTWTSGVEEALSLVVL